MLFMRAVERRRLCRGYQGAKLAEGRTVSRAIHNKARYTMKKTVAPISLAGSQLGEVRHVCAFFNSDEEEYRVLLPFIKDGFERGDKAVHVVNPDQRHDHLQRLAAAGIDPSTGEQSGQLEIRINTEAYLRDGRFDKERML